MTNRKTASLRPRSQLLEISRREFLAWLSKGSIGAALAASIPLMLLPSAVHAQTPSVKPLDTLIYASVTTLAKAIRDKQLSSEEVVNAYLQRIEAVNPKLNAVVQLTAEKARGQAREADTVLARGEVQGPLHGIPVTIKDLFDTAGVRCAAGTTGRAAFVPTRDATAVARLRAAGAIVLGKTKVPELGLYAESDNLVYGRTNNPYDLSRTPGGSSGGEGAIIAAGGSPFGLGSDGGGSIRIPAHFCGIAGIKPTSGRVPLNGHFPPVGGWGTSTVQAGPMARYVEDLMLMLPVIAEANGRATEFKPMPLGDPKAVRLKSLRVAFHTDNEVLSPTLETAATVRTAAQTLSDSGMTVEEARPAGLEQSLEIIRGLFAADGGAWLQGLIARIGSREVHPLLQRYLELLQAYAQPAIGYAEVHARWHGFRRDMSSFMKQYDVILCPVWPYPAVPHGTTWDDDKIPAFSYTVPYNLTGLPAAVVRGGTSPEGLPIGVQVVARPWREDVALAVAQQIETALGGWQRPPI